MQKKRFFFTFMVNNVAVLV